MNRQERLYLEKKINKLLNELACELKTLEGDNLISVSLTGSTVYREMKNNQDVDMLIIVKEIKDENIESIKSDLEEIRRGKLDLEYNPHVPNIKKAFEKIVKKYTTDNIGVKYKFTLGNYWGKPEKNKKYTIHLHVIGPHSIESLGVRINQFQKVVLANAIYNSKVIFGKDLRSLLNIKVLQGDVLSVLNMLKARQNKALQIINSDPELALQISIKNLGKIAMASLELKGIFENSVEKAGKLFKHHFNLPHNDLPEKVYQYKKDKERILKSEEKVTTIVNNTAKLLKSIIRLLSDES